MSKFFANQLAAAELAKPFLQDRTYAEALTRLLPDFPDETSAKEFLDKKIADYDLHQGEKLVYYMTTTYNESDNTMSARLFRLWESEIPEFEKNHSFVAFHADGKYPEFQKK